ncbi:MAG: AAA family ATPase [Gaiellales bacterium]
MNEQARTPRASKKLATTWDVYLSDVTDARFAELVFERELEHIARFSWATERMTLEGLLDDALSTYRDRRSRSALLDLADVLGEEGTAHLTLSHGRAALWVAARSIDALTNAKQALQHTYPISRPEERRQVQLSFWTHDHGARRSSRALAVPTWKEIAGNYPAAVAAALGDLVRTRFDDPEAGRLLLWHGPPGTGKTHALRALAWEWREWCAVHYVTDPETFFGGAPKYMLDVLLEEDEDDTEQWRLLILEDTGELLALDAKSQTGQGLSRLLNVVDGLIGQGLRVLVLVTTNEELQRIHPAVSRPGRCASQIEFGAFPGAEADEWLARHGRTGDGSARTLASLFGDPDTPSSAAPPSVGFSAR